MGNRLHEQVTGVSTHRPEGQTEVLPWRLPVKQFAGYFPACCFYQLVYEGQGLGGGARAVQVPFLTNTQLLVEPKLQNEYFFIVICYTE